MASSKKPPPNGSSATKKKSTAKKKAPAADEQTAHGSPCQVPPPASEPKTAEPNLETPTKAKASQSKTAPRSRMASQSKATPSAATQPQLAEAPRPQEAAKHPVVLVPSYQPPSAAEASALSTPPATSTPSQQATRKRRRSSANPKAPQLPLNVPVKQSQTTDKAYGAPQLSVSAPTAQPTARAPPTQPTQVGESAQPKQNTASQPLPQVKIRPKKESPIPVPKILVSNNIQPHVRRLSEQSNKPGEPTQAEARVRLPSEPLEKSNAPKQTESRKPLPKERPKQLLRHKKPPAQREWATVADQVPVNPLPQLPAAMESMPPAKKQKLILPDELVDQRTGFRKGVVVSSALQPQGVNGGQNEQQNQVQNAQAIPQGQENVAAQEAARKAHMQNLYRQVKEKRELPIDQLTQEQHKALYSWCKAVCEAWDSFLRNVPHGRAFKEGKLTKEHPLIKDAIEKIRARIYQIPHLFGQMRVAQKIFGQMMPPGQGVVQPQPQPQRPTQILPPQLPPMNFPGWYHDTPQQQARQALQPSLINNQGANNQSPRQQAQQPSQRLPMNLPGWNNQGLQQQGQQRQQPSPMNPVGWNSPGPQQQAQQQPHRHPMNPLGGRLPVMRAEGPPGVLVQVLPPPAPEGELQELVDESVHESQDNHQRAGRLGVKINLDSTGVPELLQLHVAAAKSLLKSAELKSAEGKSAEGKSAEATEEKKREAEEEVADMKETLRRSRLTRGILHSLQQNIPHRAKPPVAPPVQLNNKPMPTFQELALGHIKACNPNAGNPLEYCTFCTFDCDYGIANEWFHLPSEASLGYCRVCRAKEMDFYDELKERVTFPVANNSFRRKVGACQVKLQQRGLQEAHPLEVVVQQRAAHQFAAQYHLAKPTPHNTISNLDGMDISGYRTLRFCRGCPWTQIDLTKARICGDCKEEKLNILQHRHLAFESIIRDAETTEKDRRCMLCPASAYEKCIQCPLRLCGTCVASVKDGGKGWINNAIYNFDRVHLRNDAFLLRSDGGGF